MNVLALCQLHFIGKIQAELVCSLPAMAPARGTNLSIRQKKLFSRSRTAERLSGTGAGWVGCCHPEQRSRAGVSWRGVSRVDWEALPGFLFGRASQAWQVLQVAYPTPVSFCASAALVKSSIWLVNM